MPRMPNPLPSPRRGASWSLATGAFFSNAFLFATVDGLSCAGRVPVLHSRFPAAGICSAAANPGCAILSRPSPFQTPAGCSSVRAPARLRRGEGCRTPLLLSSESSDEERRSLFANLPPQLQNNWVQLGMLIAFYAFHVGVLCAHTCSIPVSWLKPGALPIILPFEVIFGTAVLAGGVIAAGRGGGAALWGMIKNNSAVRKDEELPTTVDKKRKSEMPETFMFLGIAWASSGYVGQAIDLILCALAVAGVPLTIGTSRVLQVLLAHLYWVAVGSYILQKRLGDFYRRDWNDTKQAWLSHLHAMLRALPESATEAALDNLKNPQGGGALAQVLYRGFLLTALRFFMSLPHAVDVAALIFALNHMNARAFAQLYVLGYLWSMLYIRSKTLVVPILVHMLWNGRTFLAPM
ncbi:hypothetical protein T484DRAFT_1937376 [Baffinella frigidus]|nr:hypothetical protein T484DRAFT_1937376 [Cryptophyta sp. CCMP2293]